MKLCTLSVFNGDGPVTRSGWEFIADKFCYSSPGGGKDLFGRIELCHTSSERQFINDGFFNYKTGILIQDRLPKETEGKILLVILAEDHIEFPECFYKKKFFKINPIRKKNKSLLLTMVCVPKDEEFILTLGSDQTNESKLRKVSFYYNSKKERLYAEDIAIGNATSCCKSKTGLLRKIFQFFFPRAKYGIQAGFSSI